MTYKHLTTSLNMKKDDIRRRIKAQKSILDNNERADAARAVFALLESTAAFMMAENILMYHALYDELSTHEFLDKWAGVKHFFLPRVNGVNLEILPYDRSSLALGAFHIEEPTGDDVCSMDDIEMVVVPAVAYDRRGNRVGRGKGFYDRLLANTTALKVGVGYSFQLVDDEIDTDPHDIPVDIVITPQSLIHCPRRKPRP